MKKMMKSIVCLAMAAALVLSLAACGCGYSNSPGGVVQRIMNARNNYDYVTMAEYYEEPGEYIEDLADEKINSIRAYYDYMVDEDAYEGIEDELSDKNFERYINYKVEIDKAYADRCKVEIDKEKVDDDKAEVKYTAYRPELKKSEEELLLKAAKNVDLKSELEDGDLNDGEWEKVLNEWKNISIQQIKEADLEDSDGEIKVVKKDGKWKIAEDQSDD